MTTPGTTLLVRLDDKDFWFEPPLGERLDMSKFEGKKLQGVEYLLAHRFPLSPTTQQRINSHIKYHERRSGFCIMCCFDICLPSGLLLGNTFDYDRDLPALKREVMAALSNGLQPSDYELDECVQSEEKFTDGGKALFKMYLA